VEQCREHNCEPQPLVVDAIVNHLQRNGPFSGAVCCMPPGNGKTACAIHVIFRLGRKALFVVPNLTLIPQVAAEVTKFMGPECRVGTLHTSDPKKQIYKDCDVVVASLASIVECDYAAIMPEFGTVVIDEGHKVCAQDRHTVFNKTAARYVVVLTATPERADHLGGLLEWLAGPIVWFSCTDLTNTRWGRIDVVVHELRYDDKPLVAQYKKMCGERMLDQEFVYDQLATHAGRTGWLAQTIADMAAQGRQVLCLGQRINVMKNLYEHLRRLGVDVGIIVGESNMDSKLTLEERDKVRKCRVRIYTDSIGYQALNVQELDVLFMLDPPVGDINVWIQRIGRITRDYDKDVPTIHLISDTGIVEFEGRIKSVIKKLKAFQETAFHTTHVPHVV
jgi:superfamily II DNA or RNA helicase